MARPVSITDEQIVAAARVVIAREGVGATTRAIAREAGVAEGSLFKRFASKEALLLAAVRPPDVPDWVRTMEELAGRGDPRANLMRLARAMVAFVRDRLPLLTLVWSLRLTHPPDESGGEAPATRDRRRLAEYLASEVALGRLRSDNPAALAEVLFGTCVNFVVDRAATPEAIDDDAIEACVAGLIGTLWPAIAPEPAGPPMPE